jgi:hypothetical protein
MEPGTVKIAQQSAQLVEHNQVPSGWDISIVSRNEPDTFTIEYLSVQSMAWKRLP